MRVFVPLIFLLASGNGQLNENAQDEDCEEAWNYVEFLKIDIGENIENILGKTLYEVKEKKGSTVLEETVTKTMDQVMEVRENLLQRIKKIRKGLVNICPEQNIRQVEALTEFRREIMGIILTLLESDDASATRLKEIGGDLLKFKLATQQEVMRMLTLPTVTKSNPKPSDEDCLKCQVMAELNFKVENILVCAENDEPITDIDSPENNPPIKRPYGRAGVNCVSPTMLAMELITITELVDKEIEVFYNQLIIEADKIERESIKKRLNIFKGAREIIDEVIQSLLPETLESKQKSIVTKGLRRISQKLNINVDKCLKGCVKGSCDSCAGNILSGAIEKMKDFVKYFENNENDDEKNEYVRREMLSMITKDNSDIREILIKKAQIGEKDECDEERLAIHNFTRGPFWLLVNSTIPFFDRPKGHMELMVTNMLEILQQEFTNICSGVSNLPEQDFGDDQNCDWEEFEHIKEYLEKVDDIIQNSLFKVKGENGKTKALLGFVEIQSMLDTRVKELFENQLVCPNEVNVLKKQFMSQVNKCMAEFMRETVNFSEMTRRQRISCTKELRTKMDERVELLLRNELENSLSDIERLPDFLESGSGDNPITDIDIPDLNRPIYSPSK